MSDRQTNCSDVGTGGRGSFLRLRGTPGPVRAGLLALLLWSPGAVHPFGLLSANAGTALGATQQLEAIPSDGLEETVPVSGADRLMTAEQVQKEIRDGLATLQERIDSAREAKEVAILTCLNEQHAKLRALLQVVTTATVLLREAIDARVADDADTQYRRILIARDHAVQILHDAQRCEDAIQGVVSETGEATTTVLESPLAPEEPLPGPLEAILDPDLGVFPCW